MYPISWPFLYVLVLTLVLRLRAGEVNVTIDDQYGDPTTGQVIQYNPTQAWQKGQNCDSCTAKPTPPSNAHNGTWMDASFFPSGTGTNGVPGQIVQASVPFIGTAVYVQVILTGSSTSPDGNTDFTFSIDNVTSGVFQRSPNNDTTYKFNQIVFAKTGLSNSLHTILIECGRAGQKALFMLDAITYTKEVDETSTATSSSSSGTGVSSSDNSESKSSSSNIGAIVGPIVGGIIVAGAVVALLLFMRRRRQGQRVRVLLDSPPIGAISPARFEFGQSPSRNSGQQSYRTQSDPYIVQNADTTYLHSNGSDMLAGSMRAVPVVTRSRTELNSTPSVVHISRPLTVQNVSTSTYGEVDESAVNATTPLASPPAYSEVESRVSRLPNPYGKAARG